MEIPFNFVFVAIGLMIIAALFSLLYVFKKTWVREVFYLVIMILFLLFGWQFRLYINSGFYYIINDFYAQAAHYFDLAKTISYAEKISNSYLSVTISVFFIGLVSLLFLNISVSEKMSGTACLVYSTVILMFPLFLRKEPGTLYMILMASGITAPLLLRSTGHFRYHKNSKGKRINGGDEYAENISKKGELTLSYSQDGRVLSQMSAVIVTAVVIVFAFISVVFPESGTAFNKHDSYLKSKLSDKIEYLIEFGISGYINEYTGAGGMSSGKLGGVYSVRPDYATDLIVKFSPQNYGTIYLKGFTGTVYEGDRWDSFDTLKLSNYYSEEAIDEYNQNETKVLKDNYDSGKSSAATAVMKITNVGAIQYGYVPYYTDLNGETDPSISIMSEEEYTYYPYDETATDNASSDKVLSAYLTVPEENVEAIKAFCKEAGIKSTDSVEEKIEKVKICFENNYPYTIKPGITPDGKDFVNYFLENQKEGYCVHFASASTLIFRYLGIPSRYIEGYVLTYDEIANGTVVTNESYESYYHSNSGKTASKTVIEAKINDSKAHAWTEVYIDGFGWTVADMTPASLETDNESFWSAFAKLFSSTNERSDTSSNNGGNSSIDYGFINRGVYIALIVLLILVIIAAVIISLVVIKRRAEGYSREKDKVLRLYKKKCSKYRRREEAFAYCKDHEEQLQFIKEHEKKDFDVSKAAKLMEKLSFSNENLTEEERSYLEGILK